MYLIITEDGELYTSDKLTDDIMAGASNGMYDIVDTETMKFLLNGSDIDEESGIADDYNEWIDIDEYPIPTDPGKEIGEEID